MSSDQFKLFSASSAAAETAPADASGVDGATVATPACAKTKKRKSTQPAAADEEEDATEAPASSSSDACVHVDKKRREKEHGNTASYQRLGDHMYDEERLANVASAERAAEDEAMKSRIRSAEGMEMEGEDPAAAADSLHVQAAAAAAAAHRKAAGSLAPTVVLPFHAAAAGAAANAQVAPFLSPPKSTASTVRVSVSPQPKPTGVVRPPLPPFTEIRREDITHLGQKIGSGTHGQVRLAQWKGQSCVIKEVKSKRLMDTEAAHLMTLSHPLIVSGLGWCWNRSDAAKRKEEPEPQFMILMQHCKNGSLFDYLRKNGGGCMDAHGCEAPKPAPVAAAAAAAAGGAAASSTPAAASSSGSRRNTKLSMRHCLQWSLECAESLAFLHEHKPHPLIHRDIKSLNFLLDDRLHIKLCDFGATQMRDYGVEQSDIHPIKDNQGSPLWSAPELLIHDEEFKGQQFAGVARGGAKGSRATDVFSLAVTLWEIFTGQVPYSHLPFFKDAPAAIKRHILEGGRPPIPGSMPPEVAGIITRGWSQDPAERPPIGEVVQVLHKALLDDPAPTELELAQMEELALSVLGSAPSQRFGAYELFIVLNKKDPMLFQNNKDIRNAYKSVLNRVCVLPKRIEVLEKNDTKLTLKEAYGRHPPAVRQQQRATAAAAAAHAQERKQEDEEEEKEQQQ